MERGLFIAASGMLAAQIRQDVIANNLANATNPGFKREVMSQVAFGDLLLSNTQTGAGDRAAQHGHPDHLGQAEPVQQRVPLDAEHARPGDRRQRLLRRADRPGRLLHAQRRVHDRHQRVPDHGAGRQGARQGRPAAEPVRRRPHLDRPQRRDPRRQPVRRHGRRRRAGPDSLRKRARTTCRARSTRASKVGNVAQGALETSNVNTVSEMVSLIENMREFEADQKVIRALDDTLGGAVNQVGRVWTCSTRCTRPRAACSPSRSASTSSRTTSRTSTPSATRASGPRFEDLLYNNIGSNQGADAGPADGPRRRDLRHPGAVRRGLRAEHRRATDFMITGGTGFFVVRKPDGTQAYTRAGNFGYDGAGQLVTQQGDLVLDQAGRPITFPKNMKSFEMDAKRQHLRRRADGPREGRPARHGAVHQPGGPDAERPEPVPAVGRLGQPTR